MTKQSKLTKTICNQDTLPFVNATIKTLANDERQIVVVCFGTMAISGDALGPQVGTLLTKKYNVPAFVYGTEENCVNGKNMKEWTTFVKTTHKNALIIAVDASVGAQSKIGQIVFRADGVCPAGIKGNSARFGDVGILAVVAQNTDDPLMQLMSVSPLYVAQLANKVAFVINQALVEM